MCGIAGILKVHSPGTPPPPPEVAIPESWLDILDDSIKHRGPDGHGRFRDRATRPDGSVVDVALIHRRLAIIDPACGHQPMIWPFRARSASDGPYTPGAPQDPPAHTRTSPDPNLIAVTFNGCIYNHRDLRKQLESAGHTFHTDHSDTEVLIHGYRDWGDALWNKLDAMHACAIWDHAKAELIIARDRFGEKPLYHASGASPGGEWAVFCSTFPGALKLQRILAGTSKDSPAESFHAIKPWVQFGWNQTTTDDGVGELWTDGVKSLLSARTIERDWTAWTASLSPTGDDLSPERLDAILKRAVASRLDADVPLGCFLSGGIDSALIAALATRERPDIAAYTVRMPDAKFDESAAAAATAAHLGMRHHLLECEPRPAEDLLNIIPQLGLPFGDSSLLPSLWVSRAAAREVKVALSGDGGDDLFLGYDRHRAMRYLSWLLAIPDAGRRRLASAAPALGDPNRKRDRIARLLTAAAYTGYKELLAIFPSPLALELGLGRNGSTGWGAIPHFGMTALGWCDDPDQMRRHNQLLALRFDRMFYLPLDLMRKTDTASMSVPIEVRAPMLQRELADAAMNAPVSTLMPHNQRKGLLRQVARKYLPPEIVDRPKQGFAIPISDWFRADYGNMKTLLMDHLNSVEPWGPPSLGIDLNMKFVRQMLDEHMESKRDHGQRLYMLLVLSIWAKWLGGLTR